MLAQLKGLIPGAEHWPRFLRNRSEQFEARLAWSKWSSRRRCSCAAWPVRAFRSWSRTAKAARSSMRPSISALATVALRFVDGDGDVAAHYPANPNGSPDGITGLTSSDGRATMLMPHPERVHRSVQMSWHPAEWGEDSPWMQMFRNARHWV